MPSLMDSRLHGVPLAATPMAVPSASSGIKAPLTLDESSDSDYYRNNTASDSEGFVSDEEVVEEPHFIKDYAFSKPIGVLGQQSSSNAFYSKSPDEGFVQESNIVSQNSFVRPVVRDSDDSDDSRSFLSDEVVMEDEEVSESEAINVVRMVEKLQIPIAKISVDSDDDSEDSVLLEDDGFSGVVRVPSAEILHRVDSAPKARISGEGDEHDLRGENVVDVEFIEDMGFKTDHFGDDVVSSDAIRDIELEASSFVEEHDSKFEQEHSETHIHLGEEIDQRARADLGSISSVALTVDLGYLCGTVEQMEPEITESGCSRSNFGSPSVDEETVLEDNITFNRDMASDELKYESCIDVKKLSTDSCPQNSELAGARGENVNIDDKTVATERNLTEEALTEADEKMKYSWLLHHFGDDVVSSDAIRDIKVEANSFVEEHDSKFEREHSETHIHLGEEIDQRAPMDLGSISSVAFTVDLGYLCGTVEQMEPEITESGCSRSNFGSPSVDEEPILEDNIAFNRDMASDEQKYESCIDVKKLCTDSCPQHSELVEARAENVNIDDKTVATERDLIEEALTEADEKMKYSWLLHQLGCSLEDSVPVKKAAVELESICILVIGKTGVGKSSTINSIFGEKKTVTDAFKPTTTCLKEITGMKDGVKLNVIDTPGLRSSLKDQSTNRKVLLSIKKLMPKSPPDVVLYVDRLDIQTSDMNDLAVLKSVTSCLGSFIWKKSVLVLTHADSIPPDGPDGCPLRYETFVAQRSLFLQRVITNSCPGTNPGYMIPVSLIENHPIAEKNWHAETLPLRCMALNPSQLLTPLIFDTDGYEQRPDIQTSVKNPAYILKSENAEMEISVGKWLTFVGNTGIAASQDDTGYGTNVEFCRTNEDHPTPLHQISLGLSVLTFRDHHMYGCSLQSRFSIGRRSKVKIKASLNSKRTGQISIHARCLDPLQVAAVVIFPVVRAVFGKIFTQSRRN